MNSLISAFEIIRFIFQRRNKFILSFLLLFYFSTMDMISNKQFGRKISKYVRRTYYIDKQYNNIVYTYIVYEGIILKCMNCFK